MDANRVAWRALFRTLAESPPQTKEVAVNFHTQWHTSHHFMRQLIADDDLIMDVLWTWLPRYEGPSMTLYRGENLDRFEIGNIGTGWSDQHATARMFARGLNNVGKGGVVLKVNAPAEAIIAGPSEHSLWLGEREFSIDRRKLDKTVIAQVEQFSPS
ncbi:hypothetical protein EFP18_21515 [Burkholderia glumae]|nr:hypothetical protein EFP18_21515 [Burkholderia glumae]